MKVVSLIALRTGQLYPPPPENIRVTHSDAGRIISMKNSSNITVNRIRDLPANTAVSCLPREAQNCLRDINGGMFVLL